MLFFSIVNGGYSPWSKWTKCSVTCGNGHEYRSRKCNKPTPQNGGADCSLMGDPTDIKACVMEPCPTERKYKNQFKADLCSGRTYILFLIIAPNIPPEKGWNLCSKSCGGGIQWRNIELGNGKTKNETRMCASDPCPSKYYKYSSVEN